MHMLPSPPDLAVAMRRWKERELFWIVKHGFKYTVCRAGSPLSVKMKSGRSYRS